MDRRAKLNGLDMPVRAELSGPDGGAIPFSGSEATELLALIGITDTGDGAGQDQEGDQEAEDDDGDA
jgi:hypothetical protein